MEEWEENRTGSNLVLFVLHPRKHQRVFNFWSAVSRNAMFSPRYKEANVNWKHTYF